MRPRHSRFNRIYRRITRGGTRHQWKQISQLRPHGALGHPVQTTRARIQVPSEQILDLGLASPSDEFQSEFATLQFADDQEIPAHRASQRDGGIGVALLTIALFLLACAYAAFSGYMHSHNDKFAWLGLTGALGSLVAAGVGICLSATPSRRHYSGRFLSVAVVFLGSLLGVLLLVSTGR